MSFFTFSVPAVSEVLFPESFDGASEAFSVNVTAASVNLPSASVSSVLFLLILTVLLALSASTVIPSMYSVTKSAGTNTSPDEKTQSPERRIFVPDTVQSASFALKETYSSLPVPAESDAPSARMNLISDESPAFDIKAISAILENET